MSRLPTARLDGIVERLWRVEAESPAVAAETICPDGCAEIVIHLGDPMRDQPRHLLVGQMSAPMMVVPRGRVTMVGARFTPQGLCGVLPLQDRLVNRVVALDAVWSKWTRQTAERVANTIGAEAQLSVFERALEALLAGGRCNPRSSDRGVELAVRVMRARGGPVAADQVAAAAGLSRRQFERRFRECVGLSPHLFGRIVRFQRAFAAVGHEPGAGLAARLGFVDQAHLIREVRRFSGHTPTLLAEADGLTAFFANRP
jgi:AraC-like DNA-binding protein